MVGAFWPSNLGIGTSAAKIMGVQAPKRGKNMEKYPPPEASKSRRLSVFFHFSRPWPGRPLYSSINQWEKGIWRIRPTKGGYCAMELARNKP
jgi:hypothetical protein